MGESRPGTLLAAVPLMLLVMASCEGKSTTGPGKGLEAADLVPKDDDVQDWKRSGALRTASNYDELYQHINGEGVVYVDHGFEAYAAQSYRDPQGLELEVAIFDQGTPANAEALYDDPNVAPGLSRDLADLGDRARADEGGLFHYGIEFIEDRFFVRVTIQDKTQDGVNAATLFALQIAEDIQ